jgi:2-polyprenyl-3-methyl-5-hydroxy-6-metoxy-1,4-benzoquinol methylase
VKNNSKRGVPTIIEQQQFWDWHWRNWRERKTVNSWKEQRHEAILAVLRSLPISRPKILDLGCGHGWFTAKLAGFGETTGIDLSEEGIEAARRRNSHVNFVAGNLYTYPLPTEHYDVIVSQEVIGHVENQIEFVNRAAALLRPGGYFILSCANRFVMDRLGADEFPEQPPDHIASYLSVTDLKSLLSRRLTVSFVRSILPVAGRRGILRVVHSYRLNAVLGFFLSLRRIETLKERAGFGYQLIALARKA